MFMGTGSDVGKSMIVAGLCRAFTNRGLRVRPFKPQNMSNNAAVTADGGEIGRAQALQARACRVAPVPDMNPVLLKPQTDIGAQVVVQGRVVGAMRAREYQTRKGELMPAVLESFHRLGRDADLILVEGAGSASEVNLRAGDIANMGFAEAADLPVVLIGDIERGGVIAGIVGTCAVLPPAERARLKAFLINKFRGDTSLFDDGLRIIHEHTGLTSLGVVPWFAEADRLPPEDALALSSRRSAEGRAIRIAVPQLSRIANFDDLDPLRAEPDVTVEMIPSGQPLPGDADLVILPGTKATIPDLEFLRAQGWHIDLAAHVRRGGHVLGICGGFQMLGRRLTTRRAPRGLPAPWTASVFSISKRFWTVPRPWSRWPAGTSPAERNCSATRCISAGPQAPRWITRCSTCPAAPRAPSPRTAVSAAVTSTECSPPTVSATPSSPASATGPRPA